MKSTSSHVCVTRCKVSVDPERKLPRLIHRKVTITKNFTVTLTSLMNLALSICCEFDIDANRKITGHFYAVFAFYRYT